MIFSTPRTEAETAVREIWIIGDSLTEGFGVAKVDAFPALLQKKIETRPLKKNRRDSTTSASKSKWKVVNAGNSGWTSASGIRQLRWLLKKSRPDILILALGANDGLRGLDIGAMKRNLEETLREAQKQGAVLVLAGMQTPPNYGKSYTKKFAQAFRDLSQSTGARLIGFLLEGVAGEKDLNLADGIHPNEKGHAIVAETVYKTIEDLL
ncbi:MAG: arylesterase, partial [Bdellovibrio sp.]